MASPAVHALFLSPHLDDVALSCAGLIRDHEARGERTLVVTVFAGAPPADLPLRPMHRDLPGGPTTAGELHALWERRVAEDVAAMALLGAEGLHHDATDAVFRPHTEGWRDVWRAPARRVRALAEALAPAIAGVWRARGTPRVYAPLGVGGHVDHEVCFELARGLAAGGADVAHYEDLPYALRDGLLDARLADLGPVMTSHVVDTRPHLPAHVAAARCYASQLAGMLGDADRVGPLLERVVAARGGDRIWRRGAEGPA